ncbi:MAG: GNAT family N-acetyltransferase [Asgard group archaeon]|nr:GNAT family N-acetyltransferase [Asgard group archaeon]
MAFTLRLATLDDIPKLVELRIEFIKEAHQNPFNVDLDNHRNLLTDYFQTQMKDETFLAWIAEDENENIVAISGLVIVSKVPQLWSPTGKESYIFNMYTIPAWRRKGIGSALLEKLLEESKARGINHVDLHASDLGKAVYEKYGFRPNKHYMSLWLK